jgi:hypothetical protein
MRRTRCLPGLRPNWMMTVLWLGLQRRLLLLLLYRCFPGRRPYSTTMMRTTATLYLRCLLRRLQIQTKCLPVRHPLEWTITRRRRHRRQWLPRLCLQTQIKCLHGRRPCLMRMSTICALLQIHRPQQACRRLGRHPQQVCRRLVRHPQQAYRQDHPLLLSDRLQNSRRLLQDRHRLGRSRKRRIDF